MSLGTELASNNMVHGTHFFKMNSFNLNHSNSNIQHSKCCVFACVSSLPHFIVFLPLFPSSFFSLHPFFNIPVPYYLLIVISITAIMDYMCLITSNRKQFFRKQTYLYFHPQINPWRMCLFIFIPYAITKRPTACQRTWKCCAISRINLQFNHVFILSTYKGSIRPNTTRYCHTALYYMFRYVRMALLVLCLTVYCLCIPIKHNAMNPNNFIYFVGYISGTSFLLSFLRLFSRYVINSLA